jgi:hypothetical protein
MQAAGISQETLDALKAIRAAGGNSAFKAGITTGLGYQWYDLQKIVDRTFPQITPLRNRTPRKPGKGGSSTNWKEIYQINVGNLSPGVSERNRNAAVTTALRNRFAVYAELEMEDYVTWKSEVEAGDLSPEIKAMAVENLMYATLQAEEKVLLWGNTGVSSGNTGFPLGTAPTPVATLVAGGSMTAQATEVWVVALTPEGFFNSSVAAGIPVQQTRSNVDGSQDQYGGGSSQVSAASNSITTTGGSLSISAHCAVVKGAVGYAWFVGPAAGGAAGAYLAAITTINSVLITADPNYTPGTPANGFTFQASGASQDNSGNGLIFDGYMTQTFSGSGLFASQATGTDGTGTPLTADGAGGVVEIETDLQYFWDNYRLQPNRILVSGQERKNISNKIIAGGSAAFGFRANISGDGKRNDLSGGSLARQYLAKFAMGGQEQLLELELHPNMPAGTILYMTDTLPYRVQNMQNIALVRTLQEYRQIDWPQTRRSWDYGVSVTEALEMHFPLAFGIRTNIANG